MIPIDGCFIDVLQLWPLFFDVNCSPAAGHRRLLQGCLAAVAAVLRRRLPPAKWWESLTCCLQQNTRRRSTTGNIMNTGTLHRSYKIYNFTQTVSPHYLIKVQEAQLLLRNRASAMYSFAAKLLSNAVMTYSSSNHLRSLRPMIRLIWYAQSEYNSACDGSMCTWRATPLSFEVSFLENPCEYPHKLYIARN